MPDHKTQIASLAFFTCLLAATGLMALIKRGTEHCVPIDEGTGKALLMLVVLLYLFSLGVVHFFDLGIKWIVLAMLVPTVLMVVSQSWDALNCKFDTDIATFHQTSLIDKKIRSGHKGSVHRVCFVPSWHPPQIRLSFPCSKEFFDQHQIGDKITLHIKPGFLGDEWIARYE